MVKVLGRMSFPAMEGVSMLLRSVGSDGSDGYGKNRDSE